MDKKQMRRECLRLIEALFEAEQELPYPVAPGADQLTLLCAADGYVLSSAAQGPKAYASAEALLDALVALERLAGEDAPLESAYTSLRHIA